ncbi:V-set and immunoglobulin domain-containing protein 10-like [Chanos chanos]|uniref:V-set and immunoglobulin domain-containing protein 10-like n=1 Tax=Chanos chanos TaxID=29144 RepID=UPI0011F2FBF6|nr:V-set and immunoglobulin domain-containing protein 10-like [Chanos chanos]
MRRSEQSALQITSVTIVLICILTGSHCNLTVSPTGPTVVSARVFSDVTLGVSYSGATQPMVSWLKGSTPVVTWIIGQDPPEIDAAFASVLALDGNGSLIFTNVSLHYSDIYTVRFTKAGLQEATVTFTLKVYDLIRNISVNVHPSDAIEGDATFTLYYSTMQGEAQESKWYFNGLMVQNSSHYLISGKNLTIKQPNRNDTGQYTVVLTNPFSNGSQHRNIIVLYGPDQPVLEVSPTKASFVVGESLSLSCRGKGEPAPSAGWFYEGQPLNSTAGMLNLSNVQTDQSGAYICELLNEKTGVKLRRSITINIYESPIGSPVCSVIAVNGNTELQFRCLWPGGIPEALLSFPTLNSTSGGLGDFNITTAVSQNLNGMEVICTAEHPLHQEQCGIAVHGPTEFLPVVSTTVGQDSKVMVTIHCYSVAMPEATVVWFKAGQVLSNGMGYQISNSTTDLHILDLELSTTYLSTYTCMASNPLGNRSRDIQLLRPVVSNLHVSPNEAGTLVTLTWEVPPTSIVTDFDIQMKGPDLSSNTNGKHNLSGKAAHDFSTILTEPASARTINISGLDPKSTYYFQVVPLAGRMSGAPSVQQMVGPGEGLSGPAIAGIAAGIPCSILVLLILIGLIVLSVIWYRKRSRPPKYPVSRAVEKVVASQPNLTNPHKLLTGGLKPPPEYSPKKALPERPTQFGRVGGSRVVIPCSPKHPASHHPHDVTWYKFVSRGYLVAFSRNKECPKNISVNISGDRRVTHVGNLMTLSCHSDANPPANMFQRYFRAGSVTLL